MCLQCRRHKRCWFDSWVREIPRGGNDNPLEDSYLKSPMDRGAWWATVEKFQKSWKWLSTHTQTRWTDYQKYPCFSLKNEITLHISLRDTDFFLHKQLLHFTKRGKKTKRYRKGYKPKKFPRSSIWYRHRTKWVYHAKQSIDSMQSPSSYQWYFSQN